MLAPVWLVMLVLLAGKGTPLASPSGLTVLFLTYGVAYLAMSGVRLASKGAHFLAMALLLLARAIVRFFFKFGPHSKIQLYILE